MIIMSVFQWKFVMVCYVIVTTLGGANCQLVEGIKQVVLFLENINDTSVASADEMASLLPEILKVLQDQGNITQLTSVQTQALNALIEMNETQFQTSNAMTKMDASHSRTLDTLIEMNEAQTRLTSVQTQALNALTEINQNQSQTSNTVTSIDATQTQILDTLIDMKETQTQAFNTLSEINQSQTQIAAILTQNSNTQTQLAATQSQTLATLIEMKAAQTQTLNALTEINQSQTQMAAILTQNSNTQTQLAATQSQTLNVLNSIHQTQAQLVGSMVQLHQMQELFVNNTTQMQQDSLQMQQDMLQKLTNIEDLLRNQSGQELESQLHNSNDLSTEQPITTSKSSTSSPIIGSPTFQADFATEFQLHHNCSNVPSTGQYTISPPSISPDSFPVICDMDTAPGGWLVFQRRFNGSVDFNRNWVDYENGFGSLDGEFWLGLRKLNILTTKHSPLSNQRWEFRVDLEDFDNNRAYALYDNFQVGHSSSYRLRIGSYIDGNAGDSMKVRNLNGMAFSTKDQDNDRFSYNCAAGFRSGWWYDACSDSNLNGLYLGQHRETYTGMAWQPWKNNWEVLKKTELKIRLV